MRTELYWVQGAWPGKLALSPRPRGGDWLQDEIRDWKQLGIHLVLSLLTPEEESELDLRQEADETRAQGLEFLSFPIADRQVPRSESKLATVLESLKTTLAAGRNALIHCRQGVGRTGLVAACLLIGNGISPGAAVAEISSARGVSVPETKEQREWIDHYATAFTN